MKYFVLLGDGMADYPIPELGGVTPLEKAVPPGLDRLAPYSEIGLVKTVPDHLNPPGSDIANMSVLGYNPDIYYTGRSPLEAVSMGIEMQETDLALRCNLVTLSGGPLYEDCIMEDYSADEITTAESEILIRYLNERLHTDRILFYPGISYRHCVIMKLPGDPDIRCTPPHDILTRRVGEYLPEGKDGKVLLDLMLQSRRLLKDHPINAARKAKGLHTADSIWLWGMGRRPGLANFFEQYHVRGAVVSAVDLIKGLGLCAGMDILNVENATGNIHTNFTGKADAAINYFRSGGEFVYLHVEAPAECGHRCEIQNKVRAIELIDEKILQPVFRALEKMADDFRILVLPDHPTPLSLRTHTHDAVPYMIYDSRKAKNMTARTGLRYHEKSGAASGIYRPTGHLLMGYFIGGEISGRTAAK